MSMWPAGTSGWQVQDCGIRLPSEHSTVAEAKDDSGALGALAVVGEGEIHVDGCVELRLPEAAAT